MNVISDQLPQRLRESSFRRYEQTIRTIVQQWPRVIQVHLGDLSALTVAGRLRDAMTSLYQYQWNTDIDMVKFREVYHDVVVSHRGTCVYAGSKEQLRLFQPVVPLAATPVDAEIVGENPAATEPLEVSIENVPLLCELAAKRVFNRPLTIRLKSGLDLSGEDLLRLEENFDVRIDRGKEIPNTFVIT